MSILNRHERHLSAREHCITWHGKARRAPSEMAHGALRFTTSDEHDLVVFVLTELIAMSTTETCRTRTPPMPSTPRFRRSILLTLEVFAARKDFLGSNSKLRIC